MLRKITFLKGFRCFKKGDSFDFRPGVNLLVGDQGSGKSSLIKRLVEDGRSGMKGDYAKVEADRINSLSLDFESGLPRNKSRFDDSKSIAMQVACTFSSHGQVVNGVLKDLKTTKDTLFILDEPDAALSIRSCIALVELMNEAVKNGCQLVMSVHNPMVITAFPEVLSLEHRRWMTTKEFIDDQMKAILK